MLGLLAHKRAWRDRRQAAGLPTDRPNVVFGAETHVVWDKFANYFDVEMRKIPMKPDRFVLNADDVEAHVDENTIAVGAVLGTTHIGEADPIEEINDLLVRIKAEKGWDIPLHVDGASGAFIAPFAEPDLRWDFRLEQVASINASGPQVRPGLPRRRLADLPGRLEAARGPRLQRQLPRRRAADVHVQLLARLGHDPGADVQLPAPRSQRVHRDRRDHARQRPVPQREPRGAAASSRSSTPGWPSPSSRSRSRATRASTSTTCRRGCGRTAGSCRRTACRPTRRTCT